MKLRKLPNHREPDQESCPAGAEAGTPDHEDTTVCTREGSGKLCTLTHQQPFPRGQVGREDLVFPFHSMYLNVINVDFTLNMCKFCIENQIRVWFQGS